MRQLAFLLLLTPLLSGCTTPDGPLFFPFPEVTIDGNTTLTVLWEHGGNPDLPGVTWHEKHFGDTALGTVPINATTELDGLTIQSPNGTARYGFDGYVGADLTLFAFNDQVLLQASTLSETEATTRVPWMTDEFVQLPKNVYYFGNESTPPGMTRLHSSIRAMEPLAHQTLIGQPEGGVVSFKLLADDWPFGGWVGDLYITAQIDRLVQA